MKSLTEVNITQYVPNRAVARETSLSSQQYCIPRIRLVQAFAKMYYEVDLDVKDTDLD
jgi:hypothetical protein